MLTMKTVLRDAVKRSITHDEIVHVTIDGDSGDALESLNAFTTVDDYRMIDAEGVDTMDVWGDDGDDDASNEWRLAIRFED